MKLVRSRFNNKVTEIELKRVDTASDYRVYIISSSLLNGGAEYLFTLSTSLFDKEGEEGDPIEHDILFDTAPLEDWLWDMWPYVTRFLKNCLVYITIGFITGVTLGIMNLYFPDYVAYAMGACVALAHNYGLWRGKRI